MHIQLNTFRVSFGFLFLKLNLNLALVTQVIFMNILKSLYRESLRRFICMKCRQRDKIFSQFFNFSCYFQLTKKSPLKNLNSIFLVVLCSVNTAVLTQKWTQRAHKLNLFLRNILATQSHFVPSMICN